MIGGCAAPREPGDLEPGNIDHVVAQAEGGMQQPPEMVTTPLRDWKKPNPPIVTMPKVRWIWFPPTRDRWTQYDGHWAYVVVQQFGFGIDEMMYDRALPLEALGTLRIENGQVVFDAPIASPPVPRSYTATPRVPWTPGSGSQTTQTPTATVIMDVNGQRSVAQNVPMTTLPPAGGMVSPEMLQRSIEEAKRRIMESQSATYGTP